jgi:hypothetical protein
VGAIPSAALAGYEPLRKRAEFVLDRCEETQAVDFKESAPWESLRWKLLRTIMAMGNLRGGGVIVIGASERQRVWDLSGVSTSDLATYDPDIVRAAIDEYVSPPATVEIATHDHVSDRTFLVIRIQEFDEAPFVCKKNSPDGVQRNDTLASGTVYIRPPGKPRTSRVMTAAEMHDLLELAADKRARKLLERSHRAGMVPGQTTDAAFDAELNGL